MLDVSDVSAPFAELFVLPIFVWEILFAIYLMARGLRAVQPQHAQVEVLPSERVLEPAHE